MNLNELADKCYDNAAKHGFRGDKDLDPTQTAAELMLITSELAEALEIVRENHNLSLTWVDDNGKPQGFPIEMADALIRILDTCAARGIDIQYAVEAKMAYNETRPFMHGGKTI